jgi:hypothetical protein
VRTRSAAAAQQQRDQNRLWQTPSLFLLKFNILLSPYAAPGSRV